MQIHFLLRVEIIEGIYIFHKPEKFGISVRHVAVCLCIGAEKTRKSYAEGTESIMIFHNKIAINVFQIHEYMVQNVKIQADLARPAIQMQIYNIN